MSIKRVSYLNKGRKNANFEIVTFSDFFKTRPKSLIEKDFRLNFWILLYITKGSGVHSIDFFEYPYKAGDLFVISKNQVHSFRVNYEVEGYIININEPYFIENGESRDMDMLSFFETPYGKPIIHIDTTKKSISRQLIDLLYKEYLFYEEKFNKDKNSEKLIKSLFNSFVYSIRGENKNKIKSFSSTSYKNYFEYRELVEKNFCKLKSVSDYEKIMGLTKKTINAACRECADISAKQLIINRIILEAKRLLVQGNLKNYEISNKLGFDEPANFANFFKKNTKLSMGEFKVKTPLG